MWNKEIAVEIAAQENIILSEDHWLVIVALRDFYLKYESLPPMRGLIKLLADKMPAEKNASLYLQSLFPGGLMRQGSRIAGLPKSVRCM
jgi:tRNA 2-thiouridine synthesizing protein E